MAGFTVTTRWIERAAWAAGLACLIFWGGTLLAGSANARRDIDQFQAARSNASGTARPDMALWSPARIKGWEESLTREAPTALAVLRIPRLHLEVAVLEGTDDWTLNRAVGHIDGTPKPGDRGNVGIAGHRDGFFRGLKDIAPGDVLEMDLLDRTETYRIEKIWIVNPEDVSVLDPTPSSSVTLVTCYPFYFIGSAPQRFIVRAARQTR